MRGIRSSNKYHNKKIKNEYGSFDSKKEFDRWMELCEMEIEGKIYDLHRQVKIELIPSQKAEGKVIERSCCYVADFTYYECEKFIVEDVKSKITKKKPEYIIKRKLILWRYGWRIREV